MINILENYNAAKALRPKHLHFFKIGDFYELYFEDAKVVSKALGLTLTSRNKVANGETPIPMAGVPAHAAEPYISRLLRQGFSVAVCEEVHGLKPGDVDVQNIVVQKHEAIK